MLRLSVSERLGSIQRVCGSWRRVCKDPSMWRKIYMRSKAKRTRQGHELELLGFDSLLTIMDNSVTRARRLGLVMCRAVDLSQGGLVEINIEHFGTDSLLTYIADRIKYCDQITGMGLCAAIIKFSLLEELELTYNSIEPQHLKAIGQSCLKLKTLKLHYAGYKRKACDDEALAIAETMRGLTHLQLLENRLSDSGLNALLDSCPHLEILDIRCCYHLKFVGDLKKRCIQRIKDVRRHNLCSTTTLPICFTSSDSDSEEEDNHDYGKNYSV